MIVRAVLAAGGWAGAPLGWTGLERFYCHAPLGLLAGAQLLVPVDGVGPGNHLRTWDEAGKKAHPSPTAADAGAWRPCDRRAVDSRRRTGRPGSGTVGHRSGLRAGGTRTPRRSPLDRGPQRRSAASDVAPAVQQDRRSVPPRAVWCRPGSLPPAAEGIAAARERHRDRALVAIRRRVVVAVTSTYCSPRLCRKARATIPNACQETEVPAARTRPEKDGG